MFKLVTLGLITHFNVYEVKCMCTCRRFSVGKCAVNVTRIVSDEEIAIVEEQLKVASDRFLYLLTTEYIMIEACLQNKITGDKITQHRGTILEFSFTKRM